MMLKAAEAKPVEDDLPYSFASDVLQIMTGTLASLLPFQIAFKRKPKKAPLTVDEIIIESKRFDHTLKKTFGRVILGLVIVQVAISNVIILAHFFGGVGDSVEPTVLVAWISGTVVESIGLMTVVTKYLFNSDSSVKSEG